MKKNSHTSNPLISKSNVGNTSGFSIMEFMLSALIMLVLTVSVYNGLNFIQSTAIDQADTQAALDNVRIALQVVERYVRGAGNDPFHNGFDAVTIISSTEVRICSDITGSIGAGKSNKGDPDGEINDPGENVIIRYNKEKQRLELIAGNGPPQIVADNISGFSLEYFDAEGQETRTGKNVRKIKIIASGSIRKKSIQPEGQFGIKLESVVRIFT